MQSGPGLFVDLAGEGCSTFSCGLVEFAVGVERPIHQTAHSVREHLEDALWQSVRVALRGVVDPLGQVRFLVLTKQARKLGQCRFQHSPIVAYSQDGDARVNGLPQHAAAAVFW